MYDRDLDCLSDDPATQSLPVHAVRPERLAEWLGGLPASQRDFLVGSGFSAKQGQIALLPGEAGIAGAALGLGTAQGPHVYGALPGGLPSGTVWHLGWGIEDKAACVLGFCLGAYKFDSLKTEFLKAGEAPSAPARLVRPDGADCMQDVSRAVSAARAVWLVRDLINMPANLLGPSELATVARSVLLRNGAHVNVIKGKNLAESYPTVHAVGRGSLREPAVLVARWAPAGAGADAPLVSICGKGVCFDTGGYDLKPAGGMLRMKKDMGGAAISLGLACMIIEARLPCRLEIRLGCVENMVSGDAMRPLDVLKTRKGLSVEVGNTDAEGRLVLCDLLEDACESTPDLLIDFATLTGAARVALGPDVPALFSNDDVLADLLVTAGNDVHDAVWRLPLWDGYNYWLDSDVADLNNVTEKAYAGAIVAGLFLQRFVSGPVGWAHFDVYGWNDVSRPGRPAGGEAQGMRAAFAGVRRFLEMGLVRKE